MRVDLDIPSEVLKWYAHIGADLGVSRRKALTLYLQKIVEASKDKRVTLTISSGGTCRDIPIEMIIDYHPQIELMLEKEREIIDSHKRNIQLAKWNER